MGLKDNGLIKSICRRFKSNTTSQHSPKMVTIARSSHGLSRKDISKDALKVLYRLKEEGYNAYLVGGSVRDLLLGRKPKDFDVVTDACPDEVRKIFRNSRIIGRRFKLVHVYFKDEIIEVSTFRANSKETDFDEVRIRNRDVPLMIRDDNVYGTIEEDAWRRDFTVNALFYRIDDFAVIDYTGGMEDLKARQIRMIGDPSQRFHEDPVRLLRAVRLAAKLDFSIEPTTEKLVCELPYLLQHVPKARLLDELSKLFFEGYACVTYKQLTGFGYRPTLFPALEKILTSSNGSTLQFVQNILTKTDERFYSNRRLTIGFFLSALLWPVVQHALAQYQKRLRFFPALHQAIQDGMNAQADILLITKRMKTMMQSVWFLQYHLEKRKAKRIMHLLGHRYFRAAFDLLELRAAVNEVPEVIYLWWKQIQVENPKTQKRMVEQLDE